MTACIFVSASLAEDLSLRLLCDASIFIRPLHIAGRSFCSGFEFEESKSKAFELRVRVSRRFEHSRRLSSRL